MLFLGGGLCLGVAQELDELPGIQKAADARHGLVFAVDNKFKITRVSIVGAPAASKAKLSALATQMRGKTVRSAFRVGRDLKAPSGLAPRTAQIAADMVRKALLMMDENFNAARSG